MYGVTLKEVYGYQYNEISGVIGKNRHYVPTKVGLAKLSVLRSEVKEKAYLPKKDDCQAYSS